MTLITSLPRDLFALLLPFLTGFDLVQLSHVNRQFFNGSLAISDDLWRERLDPRMTDSPPVGMSWKQFYCTRISLRFLGASRLDQRAAAVEIVDSPFEHWESEPFSFETWFALLPSDPNVSGSCFGGVLFGAQSEDWQDEWQPDSHKIFAYVSTEGDLQCSTSDEQCDVTRNLQPHRWYHLALTLEHHADAAIQCVYLDGQLLHSSSITLSAQWDELYYTQLATGFVRPYALTNLNPALTWWHDFNGVIDSFRIYASCLPPESITLLAQGRHLPHTPIWAFDPTEQGMHGTAQQVRCTRPSERVCTDVLVIREK